MSLPAPFCNVSGVINIRAVGGIPTHHTASGSQLYLKPNALFRSGEPSRITESGKDQLVHDLGVQRVFDMRSDGEMKCYGASPLQVPGCEIVRAPVSDKERYDPVSLQIRVKAFDANERKAFELLYLEILEQGGPAFDKIFRHLRDFPDRPCLVHCTAGKDRTGIAVGLFLMVLGVHDEYIIEDYALTTVGLAPAMPALLARFQKQSIFRENMKGTLNMASSRPETMRATIAMVRERYGGAEGYLRSHTSLTDGDFQRMREAYLMTM